MIELYERASLEETLEIVTQETSKEDWFERSITSIRAVIEKSPIEYRTFGTFWWPVREMLGMDVDADEVAQCSTGDKYLDLAGALLYHQHCTTSMSYPNEIPVMQDGEVVEYLLTDPEMEELVKMGK